ncbi:hypothetical protein IFM89_010202 [Coptis chinensis]|uniref:Zinc finger LSD1-type domain-containing protein n=1 Tax=Coptis chinensis TaxID=261450 RepID=A0A835LAR5_9MAGN|nr:hypothetical protein IFM89_010202 [Coptis chinensis]
MKSSPRDSPPPGWESQKQEANSDSPPPPGFESNENNTKNNSPSQKQSSTLVVVVDSNKKNYSPSQHSPLPPGSSPCQQHVDSPSSSQCQPQSSVQDSGIPTREVGQMICGVCRSLISYPKGAGRVKCPGCQTVNHVLEGNAPLGDQNGALFSLVRKGRFTLGIHSDGHMAVMVCYLTVGSAILSCALMVTNRNEAQQVGLVKCGSCSVLLMYKYESSSVRCSCCRSVTQIGVDNKRPLISVQQVHSPSRNTVQ